MNSNVLCVSLEDKYTEDEYTGDLQQDKACSAIKAMGYTSPGSLALTQLGWLIKCKFLLSEKKNKSSNMADQEWYYRLSGIG